MSERSASFEERRMVVQVVRFKSALPAEEVEKTYRRRAPQYSALPGLVQKYYLRFAATDEHGAVYLWKSEDDLEAFRKSDLARTISEAYNVVGRPQVDVAQLVMTLREE